MEKKTTYCDVCAAETKLKPEKITVIFTTEQEEGRSCDPYLEIFKLDLCKTCKESVLKGNALYGSGAQGYNKFNFKNQSELEKLRHFKDSIIGLWATDRPDLLTIEEKNKCHLFEIN